MAVATPALLLLLRLYRYAVDVPFRDSLPYTFLLMEKLFLTHTLTLRDFLIPNGEHILLVPLGVMVGLASTGDWNIRTEILLIGILAITDAILVLRLIHTSLRQNDILRFALSLAVSVILCSPIHFESWTLSMVLSYSLASTGFLSALTLLSTKQKTTLRIFTAGLLCCIASFSSPHGLLSWPSLAIVLMASKNKKSAKTYIAAFFGTVWLQRSLLPQVVALKENYLFALHEPVAFIRHFLTLLGAPFFPVTQNTDVALGIGICTAVAILYCGYHLRKTHAIQHEQVSPWIALLLFFGGSSLLISLGRGAYGLGGAYVSRYFAVSQYPAIITLILLAILAPRIRYGIVALCGCAILANISVSQTALLQWQRLSLLQTQAKTCLESYHTASDTCLNWLYPWDIPMDHLPRAAAPLLEQMHFLKVFVIPADAVFMKDADTEHGALEHIGGVTLLPELTGTGTVVSGWAMLENCTPPDRVILTSGKSDTMIAQTITHLDRSDLQAALGTCVMKAGWEVELRPETDTAELAAWAYDASKNTFNRLENTSQR